MKRRSFLKKWALLIASVAGAFASISLFRVSSQRNAGQALRIKIGKPSDYPVDTYTLVSEHDLFVYRDHESVRAVSSICTHLGCTIQRTSDGFECPCHGSCYTNEGEVVSGPAPRSLSWFIIEKTPDGKMQVDLDSAMDADYKYLLS